jgi:Ca2+-binding EF-hand superfamily protein
MMNSLSAKPTTIGQPKYPPGLPGATIGPPSGGGRELTEAEIAKPKAKYIPTDQLEYGWLEKIIDVPGQALTRGVNSFLFGLPELATRKIAGEELPSPKTPVGKLAGAGGQLGGMIKGPFAVTGKLISFGKPAASMAGKVFQSLLKKATTLGAASAASEWSGDNVKDVVVNKLKAGAGGAATGAVFGISDFTNLAKFPITSWILRFGMSSASLDAINGESPWDDRDLLDKAYSYGLNAYFTRIGISPKTYNTIIEEGKRINESIKKDGITYRVPETPQEIDDSLSLTKTLEKAQVTSARTPEQVETFAEMPRARVDQPEQAKGTPLPSPPQPAVMPEAVGAQEIRISTDPATKETVIKVDMPVARAEIQENTVELRHYTDANINGPIRGDSRGLVWFTEGQSYLKGKKYYKVEIPEEKLLKLDENPEMLEKFFASPFGKKGRAKEADARFAESEGYWAVKRGNDVAMSAQVVNKVGLTPVAKPVDMPVIGPEKPVEAKIQPTPTPTMGKPLSPSEMGKAMRIPKLFMDTPIDELQNMVASGEGGEGAKKALEIRKDEVAKPATPVATEEAKPTVEVLPEYTKEMADIVDALKEGKLKWADLTPDEVALAEKAVSPEQLVKLKTPQPERIRYQDLPEKLTISPEWKPEYNDLIVPALEKARIPRERWDDATLLLKNAFSMKKTKAASPSEAMLYYLRAKKFRERISKSYYIGGEGPETLFTDMAKKSADEPLELEFEPTGRVSPDAEIQERENKLAIEGRLTQKIIADYGKAITNPKHKEVFDKIYRNFTPDMKSREREDVMRKAGIGISRNTVTKLIDKFDTDVLKIGESKKAELKELYRQIEETQKIIDDEFERPEGRVKSGGTLPHADLPKYAGSINLERIDESPSIKDIILKTSEQWGDFEKTRRKGMTFEEISRLADAIGKTPEDMAKIIKAKTKELPEYMTHFRDILATSADSVRKLAIENMNNPTEENEARFGLAMKRFERLLGTEEAGASEMGRGLSAFRILSKSKELITLKNYKGILKMLGPQAKNQDIMRLLATLDPNDPLTVAKFMRQAIQSTTKDKLFEVWVNGILSNPKTWIRNIVSNAIVAPALPLTRMMASVADLRRGKGREIYLGEAPMMMWSIKDGIKDGARRALFAWNNELTMANVSKIETARYGAIKGKVGKRVRIPGRILIASDEFFKGGLRMADIYAMSYRTAIKEGKRGREAVGNRMAELIKNPTAEMEGHATGEALYYTFQKELGKYGQTAMRVREEVPFLKYIVPFLKTPINIAKFGVEHTPLKLIEIIYKGSRGKLKGPALSMELGKAGLGAFTALAVAGSVLDHEITGSAPQDPEERAAFARQGKKEYSVKIGDSWYSYGYLEPFGTSVGVVSDFILLMDKATGQEKSQIASKILTSFYKNMSSKTFNSGAINFLDAMRDPGRFLPKFLKSLAGSVVPSAVAGVASALDPDIREARTILDKIKSRIPGMSQGLPGQRDVFGEAREKGGAFLSRLVSPVEVSKQKNDAIESEMERLKIFPSMVDRKIKGRELSPKQYEHYVKYAGELSRSWIGDLIKDEFYKDLPDEIKDKLIRGKITAARSFVRNELFRDIILQQESK